MRMITTNDVILKVDHLRHLAYGLPVCKDVMDLIYEVFIKYYAQFGLDGYIKKATFDDSPLWGIKIKCCDGIANIKLVDFTYIDVEIDHEQNHKESNIDEERPI